MQALWSYSGGKGADMSIEDIRARHPRKPTALGDWCNRCADRWPCDAAELLAKLDAGREKAQSYMRQPSYDLGYKHDPGMMEAAKGILAKLEGE